MAIQEWTSNGVVLTPTPGMLCNIIAAIAAEASKIRLRQKQHQYYTGELDPQLQAQYNEQNNLLAYVLGQYQELGFNLRNPQE